MANKKKKITRGDIKPAIKLWLKIVTPLWALLLFSYLLAKIHLALGVLYDIYNLFFVLPLEILFTKAILGKIVSFVLLTAYVFLWTFYIRLRQIDKSKLWMPITIIVLSTFYLLFILGIIIFSALALD